MRACLLLVLCCLLAVTAVGQEPTSKIDAWTLRHTEAGRVAEFLVLMREQADLTPARNLTTKSEKGTWVVRTLLEVSRRTQVEILGWLSEHGVEHRSFAIVNMIWVRGDRSVAVALAARPDVGSIEGNPRTPGLLRGDTRPLVEVATVPLPFVEPGIAWTNADQVWALGYTGQNVVVGGQDTGYEWDHPALKPHYRGWNGTVANHDYNWHDAVHSGGGSCGSDSPFPCDDNAHGTHTMGTAVGDDGLGNEIGMAPGAQFICARNMDQGNGTPATYIECFEFFLAPYPVGGNINQGNPTLSPDVTTNSWLCPPSEGCSANSLLLAAQAHRAAGIISCVAAGNSGSGCSTVAWPPAIYDESFSIGAHRHTTGSLAGFSSRGPVIVDGSNRMKPDIAAPGVSVRSSVPGGGYAGGWSGTSMAAPHAAGAVALLLSAHPDLKGQVSLVEQILTETADHVSATGCSSSGWPNNRWGFGRLDVHAAVTAVRTLGLTVPTTMGAGPAASTVSFTVTVNNTGYVADTYSVSLTGATFSSSAPASIGPVLAGQSQTFVVTVQIPPAASIGASDSMTVDVASMPWGMAAVSTTLTTSVGAPVPTLSASQPGGPGTGVVIANGNLVPGREYYNLISLETCSGPVGSGPYVGLCATNPVVLLDQFQLPANSPPFHWTASGITETWGPFLVPAGLQADAVCFDFTGATLGGVSNVTRYTVQ